MPVNYILEQALMSTIHPLFGLPCITLFERDNAFVLQRSGRGSGTDRTFALSLLNACEPPQSVSKCFVSGRMAIV